MHRSGNKGLGVRVAYCHHCQCPPYGIFSPYLHNSMFCMVRAPDSHWENTSIRKHKEFPLHFILKLSPGQFGSVC